VVAARQIVRRVVDPAAVRDLPAELEPVLRRIYAARGVTRSSLATSLSELLPVSTLEGTGAAAERLARARRQAERVLIVGDFDADGATATALTVTCLRRFGFAHVAYRVPDRRRHGYGLTVEIVQLAASENPDLIITVDNGISSLAGVAAANELGIEVIITDHHLPGDELPAAAAIVNPNLPESAFPSKALAGVGVAFYLMAATGQRLAADGLLSQQEARTVCADCLDLVALGTVADLVPLDRNNRVLVAQGLQRIRAGRTRPGITALFATGGAIQSDATPAEFGYRIAPQLNAAGRLDDMSVGIECLLAVTDAEAQRLAGVLADLNAQRRVLQRTMQEEAEELVDELLDAAAATAAEGVDGACLYDARWHQGVVGLVASRVKDRLQRPVVAFADGEQPNILKGSARSVKGVHIRDVLAAMDAHSPGLIERFGGHAMAAGLSLRKDQLTAFRELFVHELQTWRHAFGMDDAVLTDGELRPAELTLSVAELLRRSGPWGQGFPEPMFDGRFEVLSQKVVGARHLKLQLRPVASDAAVDAIAFNQPAVDLQAGAVCSIAFRLDVNEFRGRRSQQLVVEHIECV